MMSSILAWLGWPPKIHFRLLLSQAVQLGVLLASVLISWKGLMLVSGSESPVVVVLSGSMEPAMYRGDILFLRHGTSDPVKTGQVVVFSIEGRETPIVHRVVRVHERREEDHLDILTKGDNNWGDDRSGGIYNDDQDWLHRPNIIGRVVGYLPKVGMVTIIMNDYPYLKYALIGLLVILVLTTQN